MSEKIEDPNVSLHQDTILSDCELDIDIEVDPNTVMEFLPMGGSILRFFELLIEMPPPTRATKKHKTCGHKEEEIESKKTKSVK
jgi:hypothetical protein